MFHWVIGNLSTISICLKDLLNNTSMYLHAV
jgi:hypothetical protein